MPKISMTHVRADFWCSIIIQRTPGATWNFLNIAEVDLYDAAGNPYPKSSLVAALSSVYDVDADFHPANNCIDGSGSTICHSSDAAADNNPRLKVSYPCSTRWTRGSLSRVVVTNRAGDTVQQRINSYTLVGGLGLLLLLLLMLLLLHGAPVRLLHGAPVRLPSQPQLNHLGGAFLLRRAFSTIVKPLTRPATCLLAVWRATPSFQVRGCAHPLACPTLYCWEMLPHLSSPLPCLSAACF
jgi:hypothetical protein